VIIARLLVFYVRSFFKKSAESPGIIWSLELGSMGVLTFILRTCRLSSRNIGPCYIRTALACLVVSARFVSVKPLILNLTQCDELWVTFDVVRLARLVCWCFDWFLLLCFEVVLFFLKKIFLGVSELFQFIINLAGKLFVWILTFSSFLAKNVGNVVLLKILKNGIIHLSKIKLLIGLNFIWRAQG
jgi:hypothetical protein